MTSYAKGSPSTIIPCLRYRDAAGMIDWLTRAFGFERRAVYLGTDNIVVHAELTFGNGMIMIGSIQNDNPYSTLVRQPDEIGGAETQTPYLIVTDCDAIYARAKAAQAEIVIDIEAKNYGGRGFTCRDPEGHVWSIGNYDPWDQSKPE